MRVRANSCAKLTALAIALSVACMMNAGARAESAPEGGKKPTYIELSQQLARANQEMNNRDRIGDTPIYQIDAQKFVSEQDVQALVNVLSARKALAQAAMGNSTEDTGIGALRDALIQGMRGAVTESDEDFARELLIGELLLQTEAAALGIDDLDQSLMWYMKEGWLEPEPVPDASDTEALLRQGWIRLELLKKDRGNTETAKPAYEASAALIAELIEALTLKYPSTV